MRRAMVTAVAFALAAAVPAHAAPGCAATPGGRVMLASDPVDPDVFLWDSRERLVNYTASQWSNTRAIFAHTLLARPGTQAVVVSCYPGAAHPKYGEGDEDAIGVRILAGPHKGRYGWVLSSDTHALSGQSFSSVATPHS